MLNALLGFLFGKQTNIFNKKGRVQHNLGDKKWQAWDNRLKENPNYDWRKHTGKEGRPKDSQNLS